MIETYDPLYDVWQEIINLRSEMLIAYTNGDLELLDLLDEQLKRVWTL